MYLLISAAVAIPPPDEPPMDCTGKNQAVCNITDQVVDLVNEEAGELLVTQGSSKARLRPTSIYNKLLEIFETSQAGGCLPVARSGGVYDRGTDTWAGGTNTPFFGSGSILGTFDDESQVYQGTGTMGPYGNRFGLFNTSGQVAASAGPSDNLYAMGRWMRVNGRIGVFVKMLGSCQGADYADVFDPWFAGGLPTGPT